MNPTTAPRAGEYASALADATESAERALGEARLPIHILLSAQFGELNENQEEMLGAAATALDQIAEELRTLRGLSEADCGDQSSVHDVIRVGDILQDLRPQLRDQAARAGVSLVFTIEPVIPPTNGTLTKFRDAIRVALMDEIRYSAPGTTVTIDARSTTDGIVITTCCGVSRSATAALLLARRLLAAEGATLEQSDGETTITIMLSGHSRRI